ncbi:hypothetical protein AOLI_G00298140 [Acnodon oligacanthus]
MGCFRAQNLPPTVQTDLVMEIKGIRPNARLVEHRLLHRWGLKNRAKESRPAAQADQRWARKIADHRTTSNSFI